MERKDVKNEKEYRKKEEIRKIETGQIQFIASQRRREMDE